MAGTVFGEFAFGPAIAENTACRIRKKKKMLEEKYGEHTEQLIQLFTAAYPEKDLSDLLFLDSMFPAPTRDFIEKKSAHPEAPTFLISLPLSSPMTTGMWPGIAPRSRLYSIMQIRFLYVTFPACLIAWRIRSSARGSILPATVIPAARLFLNGLHASRGRGSDDF